MSIQSINRPLQTPRTFGEPNTRLDQVDSLLHDISSYAIDVHNSVQAGSIAVAGGAAVQAVTLPAPYPDILFTPLAITDWDTTVFVTGIGTTFFTISFGTAAPGGGGVLRWLTVR